MAEGEGDEMDWAMEAISQVCSCVLEAAFMAPCGRPVHSLLSKAPPSVPVPLCLQDGGSRTDRVCVCVCVRLCVRVRDCVCVCAIVCVCTVRVSDSCARTSVHEEPGVYCASGRLHR